MEEEASTPVTRHPEKLKKLREEANGRPRIASSRGHSSFSNEENGFANGAGELVDSFDPVGTGRVGSRTQGTTLIEGIVGGSDNGIGSSISTFSGDNSSTNQAEPRQTEDPATIAPIERDLASEKERKRELARQRKQRQRDNEKLSSNTVRDSDNSDDFLSQSRYEGAQISIKNVTPTKKQVEEVKVFTKQEADEKLEKLIYVYTQGSAILDDILEIVVKGHEKVQIWALTVDEATMLATMQMETAKKDKQAAKTVRMLISIYDRMYLFMLAGPRVVQTGRHIKEHGGISLR